MNIAHDPREHGHMLARTHTYTHADTVYAGDERVYRISSNSRLLPIRITNLELDRQVVKGTTKGPNGERGRREEVKDGFGEWRGGETRRKFLP